MGIVIVGWWLDYMMLVVFFDLMICHCNRTCNTDSNVFLRVSVLVNHGAINHKTQNASVSQA